MLHVNNHFPGIFDGTHGQLGSTSSVGVDSAMVKIVQSIGKVLMVKGDGKEVEWDFMRNAVGI